MTKISLYPTLSNPTEDDILIGTDVNNSDETKNFSIQSIIDLVPGSSNPSYKVYTALLTQNGGDDPYTVTSIDGDLIIGATYTIDDNGGGGWDFTNVGAPNNDIDTSFVATGTVPTSWGINARLIINGGAPIVTVLENTIGNIWWTYSDVGVYAASSNDLFTINKTFSLMTLWSGSLVTINSFRFNNYSCAINVNDLSAPHDAINLNGTLQIEIRVYN